MQLYYLMPVALAGGAVFYAKWMAKQVAQNAQNMSPDEAAGRFHDHYAGYFRLAEGEQVVGAWSGLAYQAPQSAARSVASAALNQVSAAALGISSYVPQIFVGLTSTGRVLVSSEYSELGQRDNYKQVHDFGAGTRALGAAAAPAGVALGKPPKNAANASVDYEFVQLRGARGDTYEAWLSPQGGQVGHAGFRSILQVLI